MFWKSSNPVPKSVRDVCDANRFMWRRERPGDVDRAFKAMGFPRRGELYDFLRVYTLQFLSKQTSYGLSDFIEDDGAVSDNVAYFREELELPASYVPLSLYEAGGALVCDVETGAVYEMTLKTQDEGFDYKPLADRFYGFIVDYAA